MYEKMHIFGPGISDVSAQTVGMSFGFGVRFGGVMMGVLEATL